MRTQSEQDSAPAVRPTEGAENLKLFFKMRVDGPIDSHIVAIPPETGLLKAKADGACSRISWDCKLKLNFVPA